ncbi:hypothetical protein OAF83_01030 [Rubripirellula sp.]|nr:hypothetical protein [Rubripirellula sp.]MDB4749464.1 hypothetical protein [Rubripirellula sp.]
MLGAILPSMPPKERLLLYGPAQLRLLHSAENAMDRDVSGFAKLLQISTALT